MGSLKQRKTIRKYQQKDIRKKKKYGKLETEKNNP